MPEAKQRAIANEDDLIQIFPRSLILTSQAKILFIGHWSSLRILVFK
ncbi:MAG TPA: hypothetical protein V6D35_01935 [Candidatus Sericytochromatia bacterium]